MVLSLYWSTDACIFSLGNVNTCLKCKPPVFQLPYRPLKCCPGTTRRRSVLESDHYAYPAGSLQFQSLSLSSLFFFSSVKVHIQLFLERLVSTPPSPPSFILTNIRRSGALSPCMVNQLCIWKRMPNAPNYSCVHNPKTYPNSAAKLGIDSSSLVSWFLAVFFSIHYIDTTWNRNVCWTKSLHLLSTLVFYYTETRNHAHKFNLLYLKWRLDRYLSCS